MFLFVRSILFNILFYLNLFMWLVVCLPTLVMPERYVRFITRWWAKSSLLLLEIMTGTKSIFRGVEHIPKGGLLVASKHQSVWETFAFFTLFDRGTYILKRELMWIPLFGWYLKKLKMIPVNREKGSQSLRELNQKVKESLNAGRQIIVFPEGTRRAVDAPPVYKQGVAHMYRNSGLSVLPIAINAGLFWPRRQLRRRPGTIVAQCMPLIPRGLPKNDFMSALENVIETATHQLVQEARADALLRLKDQSKVVS